MTELGAIFTPNSSPKGEYDIYQKHFPIYQGIIYTNSSYATAVRIQFVCVCSV